MEEQGRGCPNVGWWPGLLRRPLPLIASRGSGSKAGLGLERGGMQVESLPAESAAGSPRLKLTDCYKQGNFLL